MWSNSSFDFEPDNDSYTDEELMLACEEAIKVIDSVFFFFCVAIVAIGIFGNSAGIIILLWARCRVVNSLNVYLIAAYVCDLGFLICLSLQLAKIGKVALYTTSSLSCEIAVYVVNVLSFASQWSMWAISAERYLAVCHPMSIQYRRFSTVQSAINVMLTVTVVAMALEIWVFFVVETNAEGECDFRPHTSGLFDIFNLIDSFLSYGLPGLTIFFFTYSIFRALYGRQSTFRELDPSSLRTAGNDRRVQSYETVVVISRGASERVHRRERQAAWFLMAIVLSDTILNVQNYTLRLFNTFYEPDQQNCLAYRSVQVVSYMLYYLQFAANVFYLIFCPSTRHFVAARKISRPADSASGAEATRKKSSDSCYYRSKNFSMSNSPASMHISSREGGNLSMPLILTISKKSASTAAIAADDV